MRRFGLMLVLAAALAACGDDYGTNAGGCTPTATQVCMTAATFNPASLTVTAGTSVTWRDGSGRTHTVTNDPGSGETFNQTVTGSGTFTHAFPTAGTYTYHCSIHGSPGVGMHGTITVN
ncbi:MAG TPA: plastocyanin/azurin family copper-binding protein [Gemmatimonadales bacterium]|jgi:plastocyanin|nr:plastocyanin/azurin family copper-binding protein [Gemmatimonadales bacterium]